MDSSASDVKVEQVFVGAGCNRIVNNVSWGPSGLVSFGTQNAVAIFSPETAQIITTLPGHRATVNCTQWIPSIKDAPRVKKISRQFLLSGGSDGVTILWEISLNDRKWRKVMQLPESHRKGVTCITGYMISQNHAIFASTSSDSSVIIWNADLPSTDEGVCRLSCLETLCIGPRLMVTLSLSELPGNTRQMVLAMGGLDHKIHIYCGEMTGKFVPVCQLKGHTNWIRSLDFSLPIFSDIKGTSIFLVSSSQDRTIRIWNILSHSLSHTEAPYRKKEISLTSYIEGPAFAFGSSSYEISLESLLVGHEDWVYSVEWHPPVASLISDNEFYQPFSILSASMDKTMMIWRPDKTTGIWVNAVTVGEISHCALGFFGGHWSLNGQSIIAHGYGGSFHLWKNNGVEYENWISQKVPSGHFDVVLDVAWSKNGDYLLSVSHDQTSRIFAPWNIISSDKIASWYEIARPQVHGHDVNCVAIVRGKGNHRFVSGADEKVARVFEAPLSFLKTLSYANNENSCNFEELQGEVHVLGANMSALGLSQKPVYVNDDFPSGGNLNSEDSLEAFPDSVPKILTKPPIEEQLALHTLWPETHKLYGHGNELFSLCCNHKGTIVASSCKAQTYTFAEIWLWEVGSWKVVGRLQSHSLTVTQMEFSMDDNFLLAVSRDRQFSVFSLETSDEGDMRHELISKQEAHKRIIWSCSWNPMEHEFATGSRDKSVKIWGIDEGGTSVKNILTLSQLKSSVTALSWLGGDKTITKISKGYLAIGMENGFIEIWRLGSSAITGWTSNPSAEVVIRFDPFLCHVSTIQRLAWRDSSIVDSKKVQLASCGVDHCVRVFEIQF